MLTATSTPESTVVLEEDFSLFTAGTEDQPDSKNIAPGTNYVYEVDPVGSAVENVTVDTTNASKVIENNQLFIMKEGVMYNVLGSVVK